MPVLMPAASAMAFELATYVLVSGLLRGRLPKTLPTLFVTNGFLNAVSGMTLQLIAVPTIVAALEKAKLAG